jgi:hypothetical protein
MRLSTASVEGVAQPIPDHALSFGPFEFQPDRAVLFLAGKRVPLGGRALAILTLLVEPADGQKARNRPGGWRHEGQAGRSCRTRRRMDFHTVKDIRVLHDASPRGGKERPIAVRLAPIFVPLAALAGCAGPIGPVVGDWRGEVPDSSTGQIVELVLDGTQGASSGRYHMSVTTENAGSSGGGTKRRSGIWQREWPRCMDQGCGAIAPPALEGSGDTDGDRAVQLQHAV